MPDPDRAAPLVVGRKAVGSALTFAEPGAKRLRVVPADVANRVVRALMTEGLRAVVLAARGNPISDPHRPYAKQHVRTWNRQKLHAEQPPRRPVVRLQARVCLLALASCNEPTSSRAAPLVRSLACADDLARARPSRNRRPVLTNDLRPDDAERQVLRWCERRRCGGRWRAKTVNCGCRRRLRLRTTSSGRGRRALRSYDQDR